MTEYDLTEFRGELFAFKLILSRCLAVIAAQFENPSAYLVELEKQILVGAAESASKFAEPKYQKAFVRAAKGWAATVIEGARGQQNEPSPPLQ